MRLLIAAFLTIVMVGPVVAQQSYGDSTDAPFRKNVIRYNLTSPMIYGFDRCLILGYERVINERMSASLNFGKISFPEYLDLNTERFNISNDRSNGGTNFSVDFRYYLKKENRYLPPHGIYIGPFYSYNRLKRETNWSYTDDNNSTSLFATELDVNIHTAGIELGYQFILFKRMTIDLLLVGPGIARYSFEGKLNGDLDEATKEELSDLLGEIISEKFPGMDYVLSDLEIKANGTTNSTSFGYRYLIHLGFLF